VEADNARMLSSPLSKLVLVPAARPAGSDGPRRYRLARLAVNPAPDVDRPGFEHLKRSYD
jgi:hypothetical protein